MSRFVQLRKQREQAIGTFARRVWPAVGMCALMVASALLPAAPVRAQSNRVSLYALTDNNKLDLYSFKLRSRSRRLSVDRSRRISGLGANETLVGIDFRPANGLLYGISDADKIYTIDLRTAVATPVSTLSATLSGTTFGVDFNPVPDRLRVVNDADQNLRINVDTGLVATDTPLAYSTTDKNVGINPSVVASAYTNSFAGATSTLLYGIDSNTDSLVIQNPPNAGTLTTIGSLGFDVDNVAGFDISSSNGIALASLIPAGTSRSGLFAIDLTTGEPFFIGRLGGRTVYDIALVPGQ